MNDTTKYQNWKKLINSALKRYFEKYIKYFFQIPLLTKTQRPMNLTIIIQTLSLYLQYDYNNNNNMFHLDTRADPNFIGPVFFFNL